MKINQVALQLFTVRDYLKDPPSIRASLKKVAGIGYQAVQVSGMGPIPEEELMAILDGEGLTLCATHENGQKILTAPEAVAERLRKLRCKYTAYPMPAGIDLADGAAVERLARGLEDAGRILQAEGMVLTYHNHAMEFLRLGGATVLDYLYANTDATCLQAEIDTYWVQYGGGDPAAWCEKLGGRLPLLHLKDYVFTPEGKPTYGEIGQGTLDWKKIVAAAEGSGCEWFIVEQDVTPGDPFDSARRSLEYIREHLVLDAP